MSKPDKFMLEGGCGLPRGTRGKPHPQPAFKVAHLAAGGSFLELNSFNENNLQRGIRWKRMSGI